MARVACTLACHLGSNRNRDQGRHQRDVRVNPMARQPALRDVLRFPTDGQPPPIFRLPRRTPSAPGRKKKTRPGRSRPAPDPSSWRRCRSVCSRRRRSAAPVGVLLVLQGMDTAGKGGVVDLRRRAVLVRRGRPVAGVQESPTAQELVALVSCGGSGCAPPAPVRWGSSTVRTTRTCSSSLVH